MTARTAAMHTTQEFFAVLVDDEQGLFQVTSSDGVTKYYVHFDSYTKGSTCDCPAGTKGVHNCWHIDLVEQAYRENRTDYDKQADFTHWLLSNLADDELLRVIRNAAERIHIKSIDTDSRDTHIIREGRKIWNARLANR